MSDNLRLASVFATLRLYHDSLDPDEITQRLGINPTDSHRRGELHGPRAQAWKQTLWSLTSQDQPIPRDLEPHIAWVLDKIEPARAQLTMLMEAGVEANMFCFLSCYGMGGPTLSPNVMGRLAALQLPLGLDIYGAD